MNRITRLTVARISAVAALLGCMAFTGLGRVAGPIIPEEGVLQAVGKLWFHEETGLQRDCTSFLLRDAAAAERTSRHVVTAQHCVESGPASASVVRVRLGYDDEPQRSDAASGSSAAERMLAAGTSDDALHEVDPTAIETPLEGRDVAHLCLPRPTTTEALPALARPVELGERVVVVHYAAPTLHRQQRQECKVVARLRSTELVIDCKNLDNGASGAPVIAASTQGSPEVLGVVVKAGKGFAVAVPIFGHDLEMCDGARETTAFAKP